ncbi:glycosyltransferase [Candidatus Pelagibacter sp.]|nr:glycosyltransferase [Candidatus Pelagibacter sp.]
MNLNKQITIVIVLYDSSDLIFDCLKSLANFPIIIVDNGKNVEVIDKLKKKENINLISKNKNLGYGKAINFAFEFIQSEFFLVLNPDITIDESSIFKLLETASRNKNCAIAAPLNIPDIDSFGILPEKKVLYEKNKSSNYIDDNLKKVKPEGEICVDTSKGCALFINSKHFREVNFFSDKYFLFWEEIDLCRKFLNKKLSIIVNPLSLAHHMQGKSSKLNIKNFYIRCYHSEISPLYYFNIKKNSPHLYKNIMKYFFRIISYLLILNLKNCIKNISKLLANITYILK